MEVNNDSITESDNQYLLEELFEEQPSDSGYKLAHIGSVIHRKLKANSSPEDICDELTMLGFLHSESVFMVNEIIKVLIATEYSKLSLIFDARISA